jgi:hypothetical protein
MTLWGFKMQTSPKKKDSMTLQLSQFLPSIFNFMEIEIIVS